ncbi:lipase [Fennellomyces sp. T-0311]|nr:lipase [Fennellomyces sp. T-0311]
MTISYFSYDESKRVSTSSKVHAAEKLIEKKSSAKSILCLPPRIIGKLEFRQDAENPEGSALEINGPLPKDEKTVEGGMALDATDYPDTVEAALNGTRAVALATVRDATDAEIADLEFHSALSANVYCSAVVPGGRWLCPHCSKTRHIDVVETYSTLIYDTNVLVGRDDSQQAIYVVFRGSASINNWMANLNAILANYRGATGARVHAGFQNSYQDVQSRLMTTVRAQINRYPSYRVVVTGHSLGGATALLHALDLHENGVRNIHLYTQGQPRVGNRAFANYVIGTGIPYKRAVNERDLVAHVPGTLSGFIHAGEEYWDIPLSRTVRVCPNGLETSDCANSIAPFTSFTDHTSYFGMTTGLCLL